MRSASVFPFISLLVIGIALSGCQSLPASAESVVPASEVGARRAERSGQYLVAAAQLKALAATAALPDRGRLQIEAAQDLLRAGQADEAAKELHEISEGTLSPDLQAQRAILGANIALAQGRTRGALAALAPLGHATLSPRVLASAYGVRAGALAHMGKPVAAVRLLVRREDLLTSRRSLSANHRRIWSLLQSLPPLRLTALEQEAANPVLQGWVALASIAATTAANSTARAQAIAAWRQRYPDHPAGGATLAALSQSAPALPVRFQKIALLLPLTSQYAGAAQAVEDGFMGAAAAFPDPGKPQITVYDTGSNPASVIQYYRQAEQSGAQLIVGPLGAAAVNALVQAVTLRVPTLLLSHTTQAIHAPAADVFQFGLAPGQEARQVAQRAYINGYRHAAVLFPATAWGQRVAGDFTAYWQRLGGVVPASQGYTPGLGDYGAPVEQLLNIDQSLERRNLLQNLLHVPLKFESRRRQDIDFVFLVADAQDARLIKPQLNFHHAGSLPVYSTSYIFTGTPDPVDDRDLDGITFGDMPWLLVGSGRMAVLRARLANDQKYVNTPLDRLYALGLDAYRLIPRLLALSTEPGSQFHGATSTLTIAADGVIHRQLVWARFEKGLPHLADRFLNKRGRYGSADQEQTR